ncbi:hypothetical protein NEF87_000479 [Candidatus Lokiarchaeum ossiferum]|uniref:site-specific DNA-methyltransferase (adenine-specific) n=1 Tax=Candidatus Lokiarchaeum ossiferum TaxID=2951803 RepID=A0ABY6HNP7_9ARCH|nr:hypothetical protein NEF87_000479 [Candidatus Lokiarchaeum sp. B-35]
MASQAKLLRNITTNGGLFTENILLKLRDRPNSKNIGKITYFYFPEEIEEIQKTGNPPQTLDSLEIKQKREKLKSLQSSIFNWGQRKWEETYPDLELNKLEDPDIETKWLLPLLEQIGYELEPFDRSSDDGTDTGVLGDFQIKYQTTNPSIQLFFHFVCPNDDLDKKIKTNPKQLSHHDICQQYVNYHPDVKWLILSNGTQLRLLSTYYYSYSKGYLEFNLKDIFGGDLQEFLVFFNILHPSRFIKIEPDKHSLIEDFQAESQEEGVKVGNNLRDNVHNAIETLGNQLIQQNNELYTNIKNEKINLQEYYAELLRIIYRIIFILYAEQRNMLPGSGTLYFKNFSLSSFRMLAEKPIKNDSQSDLWQKLFVTFQLVRDGNSFMGIPCFNGILFDNTNLSILFPDGKEKGIIYSVSNDITLGIIRLLTTAQFGNIRQRINFIEISEEEIGAIYESLLEYRPIFDKRGNFNLEYESNERKGTGTYYTPKNIIDIFIKNTIEPKIRFILDEHAGNPQIQENEIRKLKICDPACGSGTFLLSVLDSMGEHLAKIRSPNSYPTEIELRNARREILQHCIYGVDKNQLAVELCKISLWLRACVKDKPLNFLDNHIKCGDSLLGILEKKENLMIEPTNYKNLKCNPNIKRKLIQQLKNEVNSFKKSKNKIVPLTKFLDSNQMVIFDIKKYENINSLPEDTKEDIILKMSKYNHLHDDLNFKKLKLISDTWISSFLWSIDKNIKSIADFSYPNNILLEEIKLGKIYKRNNSEDTSQISKIQKMAKKEKFFHWYLEFPEIFNKPNKGFDFILSNPPYVESRGIPDYYWNWLRLHYKSSYKKFDLSVVFLERIVQLLKPNGKAAIITSNKWLVADYGLKIREIYLKETKIESIYDISHLNVFSEADTYPIIIFVTKPELISKIEGKDTYLFKPSSFKELWNNDYKKEKYAISQGFFERFPNIIFPTTIEPKNIMLLTHIWNLLPKFAFLLGGLNSPYVLKKGIHTGNIKEKLILKNPSVIHDSFKKLITSREKVDRYHFSWEGYYVNYDPSIIKKENGEYGSLREKWIFESNPKIFIKLFGKRIQAALDSEKYYANNSIIIVVKNNNESKENSDEILSINNEFYYLIGILNSDLISVFYKIIFHHTHVRGDFLQYYIKDLENIPIIKPSTENIETVIKIGKIAKKLIKLYITVEINKDKIQILEDELNNLIHILYKLEQLNLGSSWNELKNQFLDYIDF